MDKLGILIETLINVDERKIQDQLNKLSKKLQLNVQTTTQTVNKFAKSSKSINQEVQALSTYEKALNNVIHKYQMKQIADDQFLKMSEKIMSMTDFQNLSWKKQEQFVNLVAKAEQNYTNVRLQGYKIQQQQQKETQKQEQAYQQLSFQLQKLKNNAEATNNVIKNFGGKYYHLQADNIVASLNKLNITQDMTQKEMQETINKAKLLSNELANVSRQAKATGNNSMTFSKMLKTAYEKFAIWSIATVSWYSVVNAIKNGIEVITELDASLTELNKVADLTSEQLEEVTNKAYELGRTIGRTGKEVIDGISEFAKAGFTITESFGLTQAALVMTNVAEGIDNVEEAASSLIAVLKGYQLQADAAMRVTDMMNEVSNTTATNFDDLADGLRRTSGTLAQTGTSIEELIGLLVGGFEPLRNIEMVSSGLQMISQRLRGIDEDGNAIVGLMPKLQKAFMEIANISIIDPETGGLRSTYDILADMARVFPTLTDQQKQYLAELAAGNRQVKVLNAILSNWQSVEKAVESAKNSTGSALKENEKYLNSIQGKVSQFTSSVQQMWYNTIDSDIIKFFVDLGTGVIRLTDKVGLLNTVVLATITYFSVFKTSLVFAPIINTATIAITKLTTALGLAGSAAIKLNTILGMLAPVAIYTGLMALGYLTKASERQAEKIRQLKEEYDSLAQSLDETKSKQEQVIDRLIELYKLRNNNGLTDAEKEELERLEKVNKKLQLQIEYEKELARIKGRELEEETLKQSAQKEYTSELLKSNSIPHGRGYQGVVLLTASEKLAEDIQILEQYRKQLKEIEEAYTNGTIATEEYRQQSEKLKEQIDNKKLSVANLIEVLEERNKKFVGSTLAGDKERSSNEKLIKSAKELFVAIEQDNNAIDNLLSKLPEVNKNTKQFTYSLSDLINEVNQASSNIKNLNQAIKDNGKLSADDVFELISLYLELINNIQKTTEGYKIQESALVQLRDQQIKTVTSSIDLQIKEAEKALETTEAKIKSYNVEIEKIRDLIKAKEELIILASKEASLYANSMTQGVSDAGIRNALASQYYEEYLTQRGLPKELRSLLDEYSKSSKTLEELTKQRNVFTNLLNDVGISDTKTSKYTPSSEQSALKALYDAELISFDEYLNRLLALEKSKYSEYATKSAKQIEDMLRSSNEKIAKKTEEYLALRETIQQLQADKITLSFNSYDKAIKELDNSLALLGNINTVEEKIKETEILGRKFVLAQQEVKKLEQQLNSPTLSNALKEIIKERKIQLEIDIVKFKDSVEEALRTLTELEKSNKLKQAEINYRQRLLELEQDIYNNYTQDEWEELSKKRIEALQAEIDRLQEQNDAIKEREEREKRLLEIEKAKQILANLQKERNVRVYRDGQWVWEVDAKKVEEAQRKLQDLQTDYANWENELKRRKRIEDLQNQIEYERNIQDEKRKSYDKQKQDLENAFKLEQYEVETHYANLEAIVATELENLKTIYNNKWDEILKVLTEKLKQAEALQRNLENAERDITYNNAKTTVENAKISDFASQIEAEIKNKDKIDWNKLGEISRNSTLDEQTKMKIIDEIFEKNKKVYDTGGLLPHGGSATNLSGKPEYVLDPKATKSYIDFVNMLKKVDIRKMMNLFIPKLPSLTLATSSGGVTNHYQIHIDKVETPDAESFVKLLPTFVKQYK